MRKENVKTIQQAFAYSTDCALATVEDLAMKKSGSESEFKRHIDIAQVMCDWMKEFGVDPENTRAADIIGKTTVEEWANKIVLTYNYRLTFDATNDKLSTSKSK